MKACKPLCQPRDEFEILLESNESFQHEDEIFFLDPPDECDLCGVSFKDRRYMVDTSLAKVQMNNHWGCVCAGCFFEYKLEIGWGKAQLYTHLENGKWILTAGYKK